MRINILFAIALGLLLMVHGHVIAEVTAERSDRGVVVKIDGELFTEYFIKAGKSPAMWPVIGPTGKPMTRSYPVGKAAAGEKETDDHPHHQSIWFTHDRVNGADFWKDNVNGKSSGGAHIKHRKFKEVTSDGATAKIVTVNDWMNSDKRVCEDERTIAFGAQSNGDRWIDFTITIKATDRDVTFGDTKEGTFAVRVADPMRVEAKLGGQIVNSDGQVDDAAWGLPAKWVDYTGPVETPKKRVDVALTKQGNGAGDDILGIAIFSHPKSFVPVPRWHVRGYGLFAANPFGDADFPKSKAAKQGPTTIKKSESLTLRYRVLLHRGRTDKSEIESAFDEFASDSTS
jgi:hypothetical protein